MQVVRFAWAGRAGGELHNDEAVQRIGFSRSDGHRVLWPVPGNRGRCVAGSSAAA